MYVKILSISLVDLRLSSTKRIQERGVNHNYIKVIVEPNRNNKTTIKPQQEVTEQMPIVTGIRHSHGMSPFHSDVMDKIKQIVKEIDGGYRM